MNSHTFSETLLTKGAVEKSKKTKSLEVARLESQPLIGRGFSEGNVYGGVIVRIGEKTFEMVEKIFNTDEERMTNIPLDELVQIHAILRSLGLPVIGTMRIIETEDGGQKKLLLTDLTELGKKIVHSTTSSESEENFELSNTDEISEQLHNIFLTCISNGIQINHDDVFFLIVDRTTAQGKVILGDLSRIQIHPKPLTATIKMQTEAYCYENFINFIELMNTKIVSGKIGTDLFKTYLQGTKVA